MLVAALYLHFPDKLTLVYAVCEEQFNQMGALIDEAMAGAGDDLLAQLRAAAHAYARFALDHPVQYRTMMMDETFGRRSSGPWPRSPRWPA